MTDSLAAANKIITDLYVSIGDHIRVTREQRGVTQQELGAVIGVTRSSVANIEGGRQRIQIHALVAACQALGCDPADIISRAVEGSDPLAAVLSRNATRDTNRLRKNLLTAQANITKILKELPETRPE